MKRSLHPVAVAFALSFFLATAAPVHGRGAGDHQNKTAKSKGTVEVSRSGAFRLGGVWLGGGYSRFSGHPHGFRHRPYYYDPFFWPYYGFYGPSFFYPHYDGFYSGQGSGEIRLSVDDEEALVFIDGALAGQAKDLKKFSLEPGAYTLRVEGARQEPFELRVYVLSGKTIKINAEPAELGKENEP